MKESKQVFEIKKRASSYQARGEYDKAAVELEKLLNIEGAADEGIYAKLGDIYRRLKKNKKAIGYYKKAAEIYEKLESFSHLIPLYKRLLEMDPSQKELCLNLADAYSSKGMITESSKHLLDYIEYLFEEKGDEKTGFEMYERLMDLTPENISLKREVAELYLMYKRPRDAWRVYRDVLKHYENLGIQDKVVEIKERLEEIELILGEEDSKQMREEVVEEKYEEDDEGDSGATKEFLTVEDLLKQHKKGIRRRRVTKPTERVSKEEMVIERGQVEEKEEIKEKKEKKAPSEEEIKIKPHGWSAIEEMGNMYRELGHKEAALEEYYTAGEGYFKDNNLMKALKVYKKITEYAFTELKAHQRMVQISQGLKDRNILVEALLGLAECLYQRGDKEKAKVWYIQILKRADPENREARERLAILEPELLKKIESAREQKVEEPVVEEEIEEEVGVEEVEPEEPEVIPEKRTEEPAKEKVKPVEETQEFLDLGEVVREEMEQEEKLKETQTLEDEIMGQIKNAIYKHSQEGDPKERLELGIAMREMALYEEAITHFKAAARSENLRKEALENLGLTFLEMNQPELAIENFELALSIKGGSNELVKSLHYYLAQSYEQIQDYLNALKHYKTLYQIDPDIENISQKIKKLEGLIKKEGVDKKSKKDRISFL